MGFDTFNFSRGFCYRQQNIFQFIFYIITAPHDYPPQPTSTHHIYSLDLRPWAIVQSPRHRARCRGCRGTRDVWWLDHNALWPFTRHRQLLQSSTLRLKQTPSGRLACCGFTSSPHFRTYRTSRVGLWSRKAENLYHAGIR